MLPRRINRNATSDVETNSDRDRSRFHELHEILTDVSREVFVENADITKRLEIQLHRLRFDDRLVRNVRDLDLRIIRLTRERTHACEFAAVQRHLHVLAAVTRERFERSRGFR